MAEHTPGPWRVEADEEGVYVLMEASGVHDEYLTIYASPNPDQREADALLIAAAPELLAACKEAYAFLDGNIGGVSVSAQEFQRRLDLSVHLRAAIAKAQEAAP